MKKLIIILNLTALNMNLKGQLQKISNFPAAEKKEHWRNIHNDKVLDNYYWMYDYFGKGPDSTKVVDYLKEENTYLKKVMEPTEKFQETLFTEMKARIKEKDESAPVLKNGYYYYSRTDEGSQYYKYCRKKGNLAAKEEILLDVDQMAKGHSYYSIGGTQISEDNKLLAYSVDDISRRQYTIYVKNLESGDLLKDEVKNTEGNVCWANDNTTFFYTSKNPTTLLSEKIKRHVLGTYETADVTVYTENDNTNYIGVSKSKNKKYIFITSSATMSSEVRMIDASKPYDDFKVFQPRIKNVIYYVTSIENKFLVSTNENAVNFKIMECSLDNTNSTNWKELIPHRKDVLLQRIEEFKDFMVINERKDGLANMRIINLKDKTEHYINFGEAAYSADFDVNPEYNSHTLRYNFSSFTVPTAIYNYDLITKNKVIVKQMEVLGGYNASDYISERIYATAKDGVKIPISLVYKKGFKKDGKAPLLLYAYGSYGASMDVRFNSANLSLLNRGFVYAIAHIRGGQDLGRQWYEDGKLMKKKNTFTDFINCGEYLIQEKYTGKGHLYANGVSAGGLLMGAIANMSPDLWNGIIAGVPFVDVINTMLDESIPLTTNEFDEWGNPKNKEAYFYMKSYSPYENVEKKNYPNILVTTGLHDSQVQYFEPAKWVAKLRDMKTDSNFLLLRTDMDFGHGGASGRFDYLKNKAMDFSFLFALEGIYK